MPRGAGSTAARESTASGGETTFSVLRGASDGRVSASYVAISQQSALTSDGSGDCACSRWGQQHSGRVF